MSTNIDSLDIQIKTSAGSSAANIEELAAALTKLSASSNLTKVSNSLTKLGTALTSIQGNSAAVSSLSTLAGAMSSLAAMQKPAGLSSTLTQLKKLGEVTAGLDDATLTAFAGKMQQLSTALAPLATQINAVADGFNKLPKRVTSAVTATNKMAAANKKAASAAQGHAVALDKVQLNMAALVANAQAAYGVLQSVVNVITPMVADAIEWDGIQFRFGRAFGEDAEEVYAHAQRINEALDINMQQFMQYSSLYGSLLKGFGMEQDKVTAISVGLTELSYDIWAAYNDRYKTLEDASEAIRSAITGEIEPIRNAGIALTEASMQEYLDSVGQAHISIEKLTEAQKAEVRYAAMVDAAMNQGIVGTYANETQTAEGAVRTLSQQLKSLGQALGSILIPMLSAVLPYISAFVSLLYDAVAAVAAFFGIPFFAISWGDSFTGIDGIADSANDATDALGKTGGAAKKLKDYMMGFDELNVISPDTGGGGGAGPDGGTDWEGLDLETLWDESVFGKVQREAEELKTKIKGFFEEWKTEIAIIGAALGALGIATLLGNLGTAIGLGETFLGVLGTIKRMAGVAIVLTLQWSLMSEFLENFIETGSWESYVWAAITAALGAFGSYLLLGKKGLVLSLGITAVVSLKSAFEDGEFDSSEEAVSALTGLAAGATTLGMAWKTLGLSKIFGDIAAAFSLLRGGASLGGVLAALFPGMATVLATATAWVTGTLVPAITSALTAIAAALGVSVGAVAAAIAAVIIGAILLALNWDKVTHFFTESVPEWFSGVKTKVSEWWSNFDLGETIRGAMGDAKKWFEGVRDDVIEFWDDLAADIDAIDWSQMGYNVGQKVGEAFKNAGEWFSNAGESVKKFFSEDIPKFFTEALPTMWEDFKSDWNTFWGEKVPALISDMVLFFLVEVPNWIEDMKQIGKDTITGMIEGIGEAWDELLKGITEWIDGFVQGFKDGLGISSPSKVFIEIGRFIVEGLINGIAEKWEALKSWYTSNIAPKLTLEFWKGKFDTIRQAFAEKLEEARKKVVEKWTAITSWFTSNVAPKFTLTYWKNKFEPIRKAIAEKLEEVRGKISEKWTAITSWFNSNVAPKFTLDYWKGKFDTIKTAAAEKLEAVKGAASEKWKAITSWFDTNVAPKLTVSYWQGQFDSIRSGLQTKLDAAWTAVKNFFSYEEWKKKVQNAMGAIRDYFKIPDLPKIGLSVTFNANVDGLRKKIVEALGLTGWPSLNWYTYASGGFPSMGEMFIAREAGPELVGRIGNRTTVANNDQIVEGISAGVYQAVVAAMSATSGSQSPQPIVVYLDGKQIYASVKKTESERGVSIMGNQLGYAY